MRLRQQARAICSLALERFPSLVDPRTGLAVQRADGPRLTPRGTSARYTAIAALGLAHAEANGLAASIDPQRLLHALGEVLPRLDDLGDVGLTLWAAVDRDRDLAERALAILGEFSHFARRRSGTVVHTTELAWATIGLGEALAANVGSEHEVRALYDDAFGRLLEQRGTSGLFAFARPLVRGAAPSLESGLRAELGFFDGQAYGMLAAARRVEILGDPRAREVATTVGRHVLEHQQPRGQWSWHYNVRTGGLVETYPVYSVHQAGMGPMALRAVERAVRVPTEDAIARGVNWLFGDNELGLRVAQPERALVWRSIRRRGPLRALVYPLKLASFAQIGTTLGAHPIASALLTVDHELRPYELGWYLYALAGLASDSEQRSAQPTPRSHA